MRYTGPVNKKSRRYGFSILENNKEFSKGKKRATPPGQHGAKRVKLSNYGVQLHEKQKIQYMYGITERQLRNTYKKAKALPGILGENLLVLLETRLDNVVFKSGLAPTRRAARQLVTHGHVLLNGKKADIPSMHIAEGSKIAIKEKSLELPLISETVSNTNAAPFIELNKEKKEATLVRNPERSELNQELNEQLVIEWYNRIA